MELFCNKFILKDEPYKISFYPVLPKLKKNNSVYLLTDGILDDIIIDEYTSIKMIRQGKYTRFVEITTFPYVKEIHIKAPAKENSYYFDVYAKATIKVVSPTTFYSNRNLDVEAYFTNLLSLDVRQITKEFSILDFSNLDEKLAATLAKIGTIDDTVGFQYTISVVDAMPSEEAKNYVRKMNNQVLDTVIKSNAAELGRKAEITFSDAIWAEVVNNKITQAEAVLKIEEYNNSTYEKKLEKIKELVRLDILTDADARDFFRNQNVDSKLQIQNTDADLKERRNSGINKQFEGE